MCSLPWLLQLQHRWAAVLILLWLSACPLDAAAAPESARDHMLRREEELRPNNGGEGYYDGEVCTEPPCCQPADCVFPFSHGGQTYEACAHDGLFGYWCGKERAMNENSRWDYCTPVPKDGNCPSSTLQEDHSNQSGWDVPWESSEHMGNIDNVRLSPKKHNIPDECLDKPLPGIEVDGVMLTSCLKLGAVEPNFCKDRKDLADVYCRDSCGLCVKASVKRECEAPIGIPFAKEPPCKEGGSVPMGQWCTPRCHEGYTSWVDISGIQPNWACFDGEGTTGLWGYKLCCSGGELNPPSFTCVKDIFSAMDADNNGKVSKTEYQGFNGDEPIETKLEDELLHKTEEKAKTISSKIVKNDGGKEDNKLVRGFVIFTSSMLMVIAIYSVCWVNHRVVTSVEKPKTPSKVKTVVASEKVTEQMNESGMPVYLIVETTRGAYCGVYEIQKGLEANKKPVWKRVYAPADKLGPNGFTRWKTADTDDYIYAGLSGRWFIGDADELAENFACDRGSFASQEGEEIGYLPLLTSWMSFDGEEFQPDPDTIVKLPPKVVDMLDKHLQDKLAKEEPDVEEGKEKEGKENQEQPASAVAAGEKPAANAADAAAKPPPPPAAKPKPKPKAQ